MASRAIRVSCEGRQSSSSYGLRREHPPMARAPPAPSLTPMPTLVLLRHGESEWNARGLFTGWVDVGLSDQGAREAAYGGRLLAEAGIRPDVVHTSVLKRAIQTANIALEEADLLWLPVRR